MYIAHGYWPKPTDIQNQTEGCNRYQYLMMAHYLWPGCVGSAMITMVVVVYCWGSGAQINDVGMRSQTDVYWGTRFIIF